MRPRFGPGPTTAVLAGLVPYLGISFIMFGLTHGGLMTMSIWTKMTAISLVTTCVGAIAGASVYRE
jgi:hypothetical protein